MFYFRINRLKVVNNREGRNLLRVFGMDRAEVQLNSFITTDQSRLPQLDDYLATNDLQHKQAILTDAVHQVVNSRTFTTIHNVTDNHVMTFGDTGYVLYQSEQIPSHLDWILLAIESDRDARDIGADMAAVTRDPHFEVFNAKFAKLAATVANPYFAAGVEIAKLVGNRLLEGGLRSNQDDMIGLLYTSLNRQEHYYHGERKVDQVPDLTNNMYVDYSLFGFDAEPQAAPMYRLPPVVARMRPVPRQAPRRRSA